MSLLSDRRFVTLLRVALGVVFVMAALPKLADPEGFARAVSHYRAVPVVLERGLALVLPPLELLAGVGLLLGVLDAGASLVVLALMLVFDGAVAVALARGLDISCGCFDTDGGAKVGVSKLAENVVLTLAAYRVWTGNREWLSLGRRVSRVVDVE